MKPPVFNCEASVLSTVPHSISVPRSHLSLILSFIMGTSSHFSSKLAGEDITWFDSVTDYLHILAGNSFMMDHHKQREASERDSPWTCHCPPRCLAWSIRIMKTFPSFLAFLPRLMFFFFQFYTCQPTRIYLPGTGS